MSRTEHPRTAPATAAVTATLFVLAMVATMRLPVLVDMAAELSLTASDLGLMTACFAVGRLATDLPAGVLFDRASKASMLIGGALLMAAGSVMFAVASGRSTVLAAAVVLGIGSSISVTTGMGHASEAAGARRGQAMALFTAGMLGGQAIGPTLGGFVGSGGDWRLAVGSGALVALIAIPIVLSSALRRAGRPDRRGAKHHGQLPRGPRFLSIVVIPFAVMFTLGGVAQTTVPLIGGQDLRLTPATIGMVLGVGGLARMTGTLVGGRISDARGRRAAIVPALTLQAAGVALLAIPGSLWAWVAGVVAMSLGSFGIAVGATMIADLYRSTGVGRPLGAYRFTGDIGLLLGPLITSRLYEFVGPTPAALVPSGLLILVLLLVLRNVPETLESPSASG
jgi:predicted MFS family arabinose efflux permease